MFNQYCALEVQSTETPPLALMYACSQRRRSYVKWEYNNNMCSASSARERMLMPCNTSRAWNTLTVKSIQLVLSITQGFAFTCTICTSPSHIHQHADLEPKTYLGGAICAGIEINVKWKQTPVVRRHDDDVGRAFTMPRQMLRVTIKCVASKM